MADVGRGPREIRLPRQGGPAEGDVASDDLEAIMQGVSRVVSILGLGAMAAGFVVALVSHDPLQFPGSSAASLGMMISAKVDVSLVMMSGGIMLLALLPMVRVVLALWLYLRKREVFNNLVALAVFLELVLSTVLGG